MASSNTNMNTNNTIVIVLLAIKTLVPIVVGILVLRSYFKGKKIETKRCFIKWLIKDIKIRLIECDNFKLKEQFSLKIQFIVERIDDFEKQRLMGGEMFLTFVIGAFTNRKYNLIEGELDQYLEELNAIKDELPESTIEKIKKHKR
ncbi:hypothetical protein [Mulberry dwarf phytoplasma]|uniref:hypothetical protein n=1 Tax=Mulberry dwarf phytoplasma TaxID=186171 RepID=UPI001D0F5272|nr:hypothetical protein [Mulberry dwarf phytoplasma]